MEEHQQANQDLIVKRKLWQLIQEFTDLAKSIYERDLILQRNSETYWQNAKSTYLAPREYYEKKERALIDLFAESGRLSRGLDIGCGDGRYTRLLARTCDQVIAYEMSIGLMNECKNMSDMENIGNVTIKAGMLPSINEDSSFEIITCLGITSCIISERLFKASIRNLASLGKPKSMLVTIDTLSTEPKDLFNFNQNGYVARYRNICRYQHAFESEGYILTGATKLLEDRDKGWINRLSIFQINSNK